MTQRLRRDTVCMNILVIAEHYKHKINTYTIQSMNVRQLFTNLAELNKINGICTARAQLSIKQ